MFAATLFAFLSMSGRAARSAWSAHRARRHRKALARRASYELSRLDGHTLRDLGMHRSELVMAEFRSDNRRRWLRARARRA